MVPTSLIMQYNTSDFEYSISNTRIIMQLLFFGRDSFASESSVKTGHYYVILCKKHFQVTYNSKNPFLDLGMVHCLRKTKIN